MKFTFSELKTASNSSRIRSGTTVYRMQLQPAHDERRWRKYAIGIALMSLMLLIIVAALPFSKCAHIEEEYQSCLVELHSVKTEKNYVRGELHGLKEEHEEEKEQCDIKLQDLRSACQNDWLKNYISVIILFFTSIIILLCILWRLLKYWESKEATLQSDKNILQKEKDTLQREKDNLMVEKNTLEGQKSTLQEKKDTLENERANLWNEKDRLQKEKHDMENIMRDLMLKHDGLKAEYKALWSKHTTLNKQYKKVHDHNSRLQEKLDKPKPFWNRWFGIN